MKYTLKELLDTAKMQGLLDSLNEVHSLPSAIIDIEGTILTATAWQDVCTKFHRVNPDTEKKCLESDRYLGAELSGNSHQVIYRCPLGLVDAAIPIIIEGKHLGNIFSGQLFMEPPDENYFKEQAIKYGFDETEYLTALRKVPILSEEQLHKNLTFINIIATMMVEQAQKQIRMLEASEKLKKSAERQRSILQTTKDGVWLVDMQGNILEVNESYARMSGYDIHELLTMNVSDLEAIDSREDTRGRIENIKLHTTGLFESRHRRKDGSVFDVEVSVQYQPDDGGQFISFIHDMSERKQAESALYKSEELLSSAMESLPVPLLLNDADGTITFLNKEFVKKTGYTRDDIRTINDWWLLAYPDINYRQYVVSKWFLNLEDAKRTGRPFEPIEVSVICKDGLQREFICNVSDLEHDSTITYMVFLYDITERGLAEKDLKHSHELMSYIIQHNQNALAVHDKEMRYLYVSQRYLDDYKVSDLDIIGKYHYDVFPDLPRKWREVHKKGLEGVVSSFEEDSYERDDGTVEWTRWECRPWYEANGTIGGIIIYSEVITERKRAEEHKQKLQNQLQQSQKIEAIGRLAGGVAHDFNNMLSVILGHAELGLALLEPGHPVHANLFEIRKSAEHSTDLTRQLLAFARRQVVTPKVIDLNEAVGSILKMLQRLIGEDIHLNWRPAERLWPVKIDLSQLDQILANLCVNARDAISDVGTITIETENRTINENYCISHVEVAPGNYVRLSVSDDGCGMDKETVANIFEPFYPTKGIDTGAGLGLATVYGAVKQNNGYIDVFSEPGTGTVFTIYLPCHEGEPAQVIKEGAAETYPTGNETVLLVEDEPSILNMVSLILARQGYNVLAANSPATALQLAREYEGDIHLLLTDVIMPGMNGRDLVKNMLCLYPHIKCLFMSGYTADLIAHHGVLDEGVHFIQKPLNMNVLTAKLREVLSSLGRSL